jgi:mRNA turnover protein 4
VNLTQVKNKRSDLKRDLVTTIRDCVDTYPYAYVFSFDNMRSTHFKGMRSEWSDSRFFLGKNKVMQKALGDTPEEAVKPKLHLLAADLVGNVGLLFSKKNLEQIQAGFAEHAESDYARAGFVPSETITIPAGHLEDLPHTMMEVLRKLGMPVRLDKGKVVLESNYDICTAGETLTPDQGRLLKHFGHPLAVFQLHVLSSWSDDGYTNLGYTGSKGRDEGSVDGSDGMDDDDE